MSRYETFVIRVWVEDEAVLDHGEVRHLTSGIGLRFRRVHEVIRFIERVAASPESHANESTISRQAKGLTGR
jgi:hypothetical protein